MKKRVLLSSIVTIALCLCLICGSTFALFTDDTRFNIAVTSGDVEILATAGIAGVHSALGTDINATVSKYLDDTANGGGKYVHVPQNNNTYDNNGNIIAGVFSNGGTATLDGANLVIDRITPGDRVDVAINVENTSNVAITYRYKIEASDTNLARGMVVTIGNTGYESLKSWTSQWYEKDITNGAGDAIDPVYISVELPVYAGNEYQSEIAQNKIETVTYKITVEAIQRNAITENEECIIVFPTANGLADGLAAGVVTLDENYNGSFRVDPSVTNGTLNLDGNTLNGSLYNQGNITVKDGSIAVAYAGFENHGGEATLDNVTVNAGTDNDYALINGAGAVTTYNNTTMNSAGGGIGALDGAQVVVNGGAYVINSNTTSGRYNVYAVGAGTTVTINDGEFSFANNRTLKRAYVYAGAGATVIINGGTFGAPSTRADYAAGILGSGTVIINGGTFGFDPTNWVNTQTHQVVENNGVWTVSAL